MKGSTTYWLRGCRVGMTLAFAFIAICWIGAVALYWYIITRVEHPGLAVMAAVAVPVLMFGSLWVPDLWL